jgi:hypothetical protein
MLTYIQGRSAFPPAFPEVDDSRPLPEPTTAPAGSEAKLAEFARRAGLDLQLFHPDDNRHRVWDEASDAPDNEDDDWRNDGDVPRPLGSDVRGPSSGCDSSRFVRVTPCPPAS